MSPVEEAVRSRLASCSDDPAVVRLLGIALVRALLKEPECVAGVPIAWRAETLDAVAHVADWIASSVAEGASWLERTDLEGRPLKLAKIGSLDRAVREADKAMLRFSARNRDADDGSDVVEDRLADGWYVARLTTREDLVSESAGMQHCIGQGGYVGRMSSGSHVYLSLRDPTGRPHATIEIDAGTKRIGQLQGKQNRPLIPRHAARLSEWLLRTPLLSAGEKQTSRWLRNIGRVEDISGIVHFLRDTPDRLNLAGDTAIVLARGETLPRESLVVQNGNLEIDGRDVGVVEMPRRLQIRGNLVLRGGFRFPEGCTVDVGDLDMSSCRVAGMPDDLHVLHLDLTGAVVDRLPGRLRVDKDLRLAGSSVSALPDGCRIGGELDLSRTSVASLPKDLSVGRLVVPPGFPGDVPRGATIGTLVIEGSYPRTIAAGTRIPGDLFLKDVGPDIRLPPDLFVGCHLALEGEGPERLPDGLWVGGNCRIGRECGTSLSPRTFVGGTLHVVRDDAGDFPDDLVVGRSLLVEGSADRFGRRTRIGGSLDMGAFPAGGLPEDILVHGAVTVSGFEVHPRIVVQSPVPDLLHDDVDRGDDAGPAP